MEKKQAIATNNSPAVFIMDKYVNTKIGRCSGVTELNTFSEYGGKNKNKKNTNKNIFTVFTKKCNGEKTIKQKEKYWLQNNRSSTKKL